VSSSFLSLDLTFGVMRLWTKRPFSTSFSSPVFFVSGVTIGVSCCCVVEAFATGVLHVGVEEFVDGGVRVAFFFTSLVGVMVGVPRAIVLAGCCFFGEASRSPLLGGVEAALEDDEGVAGVCGFSTSLTATLPPPAPPRFGRNGVRMATSSRTMCSLLAGLFRDEGCPRRVASKSRCSALFTADTARDVCRFLTSNGETRFGFFLR